MNTPVFDPAALCARDAVICGDVRVEEDASVWFHAVIRAESAPVIIGRESNIQDNCVLHVGEDFPLTLGERVTVGHGAILHGCTIGDDTVVGMGSIVLNGARVGRGCILGAGSLVTQGMVIPDGMLAYGNPARVRRALTEEELAANRTSAGNYVAEAREYEALGLMEHRT